MEPKGHLCELVEAGGGGKCCLFLVLWHQQDLPVPLG